ncbi:MAG TPA: hypothetical protein VFX03_12100, partial [Thermomicrobiales bacterium]|nr:hypothetical protein [Thermomicrobiales bacterium]
GYRIEHEVIELVSFRATVSGRRPAPPLRLTPDGEQDAAQGERTVHFRGHGPLPTAIYRRYALPPGAGLEGPCILEEPGSTTLVEPEMRAEVLADGQLLIYTGQS